MIKTLYYVTSNAGKYEEVASFLQKDTAAPLLHQYVADISEIQSMNQREVALDKAEKAWQIVKKPLIIDDAGIYFEKYYEFPGVLSKYVSQGIGISGVIKLINHGDRAYYKLQLVYVDNNGRPEIFEGYCPGYLVIPEQYSAHVDLPYDDIFVPDGLIGEQLTYAQLRQTARFEIFSYRLQAVGRFLAWLRAKS